MNATAIKNPLIRQGWLRAMLFCVFYFILLIVSTFPRTFLFKSIRGNTDNINELLSGEYLWLSVLVAVFIGLLAVFLFRTFIDRRSFASMGFTFAGHRNDAISGFMLSITILGMGTMILYFSKHLQWTDITFNARDLFIELGLLLFVALYEETMFRGYILNNLLQSFNKWIALLISAMLFAVFHAENPGVNIIPVVNIFLAGILLGINYIYTRNLWFAILFHFGWNFFQGPILGYKVSGVNLSTLLQSELKGDLLLTGGDFGFEGSVFCSGLLLIASLLLYRAYETREQAAKFNIQ